MNNVDLKKQLVDLLIKAHVTMGPHSVADYLIDNNVSIQKTGTWEPKEVEAFWIHNMEESLRTGLPTKATLPVCSCCKTEFGTMAFDYAYCPKCGAKMVGRR